MSLSISQTAFTQQRVFLVDGDTLIGNTPDEQAFWVKQYFKVKELDSLNNVNLTIITYKDSIIDSQREIVDTKDIIIENNGDVIEMQKEIIDALDKELTEQKKAVRRQKIYKWTAIILGGAGTTILAVLYLTK